MTASDSLFTFKNVFVYRSKLKPEEKKYIGLFS